MTRRILFRGALLLDPERTGETIGDVMVEQGVIAAIGPDVAADGLDPQTQIVDCQGLALAPGLIDMRVITGEPGLEHKETLASASRAAAAGGVTSIVVMPDTDPVIDDAALVDFINRRARATAQVRVYPAAALTKGLNGRQMAEIGLMAEAGAVLASNGSQSIADSRVLRRALAYANGVRPGGMLVAHRPEDPSLAGGAMHEGELSARLGVPGIPSVAETIMLHRDLVLTELTGARLLADQISTRGAVELLADAKRRGVRAAASVSINHLALNEIDVGEYRTFAKLSPPLRAEEDRKALAAGLRDGVIDVIVSGHAPQPAEDKRLPFDEAAFGAAGLESLIPGAMMVHDDGAVPLSTLIRAMTLRPAELLGLEQGRLGVGRPADLCLFDPGRPFVFDVYRLKSRSKNSPFDRKRMQGRVARTYVGGRMVYPERSEDRS